MYQTSQTYDGFTYAVINGRPSWVAEDGSTVPFLAGSDDADTDANANKDGDAGDPGATGNDESDSRRATDDGEDTTTTTRAADDKGDKGEGVTALQKRLSTVIGERNAWRKLGKSPEEVLDKLQKAERVERALAGRARDDGDEKEASARDRRANAFRQVLNETFGDGADEDYREFRESRRMQQLAYAKTGVDYIRDILEDHKLPTDDASVTKWEKRIASEIKMDTELLTDYHNPVTQRDALEGGFKRLREDIVDPALAVMGAGKLAGGARRRAAALSSGRPGIPSHLEEDLEPPKTMKDPEERLAWHKARIRRAWNEGEGDVGPI